MATVLLVSEQRMKNWTSLDNNIRIDVLTPSILNAQEVYTQSALGTSFYNRIKEGIVANDLTTDEATFLKDYIGPALMQYALYLVLPNLKYKFVEKGILNGTSEETSPTTLDELTYLREAAMDLAQFYDERLKEFLWQNPSMFPLWANWSGNGMPSDKETSYFSGLQTDIPIQHYYGKTIEYQNCGGNCGSNCGCNQC